MNKRISGWPDGKAGTLLRGDFSSMTRCFHHLGRSGIPYFAPMKYTSFRQIPVWQESVAFAAEVYTLCEKPKLKCDFRSKDQLKAAVSSISNNIAEGFEYRNNKQLIRFLFYAKGSSGEVFNILCILFEAGSITQEEHRIFSEKTLELGKKIGGFIKYLNENQRSRS